MSLPPSLSSAEWLEGQLKAAGWSTERIPVTPGRDDLYARSVDAPCAVTLSTHLDTVPPMILPRREGSRIHGRGACDAKGIAASMVVAAERLRVKGQPVGLLFVVGEEVSHDGAHAANEWVKYTCEPLETPASRRHVPDTSSAFQPT